jgi:hypothetical protein
MNYLEVLSQIVMGASVEVVLSTTLDGFLKIGIIAFSVYLIALTTKIIVEIIIKIKENK